jgi:hypothetical protein
VKYTFQSHQNSTKLQTLSEKISLSTIILRKPKPVVIKIPFKAMITYHQDQLKGYKKLSCLLLKRQKILLQPGSHFQKLIIEYFLLMKSFLMATAALAADLPCNFNFNIASDPNDSSRLKYEVIVP